MRLTITLPAESRVLLSDAINKRFNSKQLFATIFKLFDKLAARAAAYVIKNKLSSQVLRRRTGSLAKSIAGNAFLERGIPGFRVGIFRGPAVKYAGVLEWGTRGKNPESPYPTIRPKNAKALAMPVDDALTPAGVARWPSPRDYPGTLAFVPFRSSGIAVGALYDAASLKAAKQGKTVNWAAARRLYVLLKQLDLPAFHYLRDGLREFLPTVAAELTVLLKEWLNGERTKTTV